MNIMTTTENRPAMAKAIAEHLGLECKYQGPPSFSFIIGDLIIKRDGSIESENQSALETIKPFLRDKEWLDEGFDQFLCAIPITDLNGSQLVNIINMVHSKQYLLNRILGSQVYEISHEFVLKLRENPPQTQDGFLLQYAEFWQTECRGLAFEDGNAIFTFGLNEDADLMKAYAELAASIVKACKHAQRVSSVETIVENEKFYLRAWLVRIGMDGPEYKTTRKALLSGLKGHTAFKTDEQKERHRMKHQAKKEVLLDEVTAE